MKKEGTLITSALRIALLTLALAGCRSPMVGRTGEAPERPWRSLDLVRDEKIGPDWIQVGWGRFVPDDGSLRTECDPKGMGFLLYRKEKLGDCQVRVVYRCKDSKSNSGVFVRIDEGILERLDEKSAPVERKPGGGLVEGAMEKLREASESEKGGWYPVHHGYEVQICEDYDPYHRTGAVYSLAKSDYLPRKAPAEWKTMVITVQGNLVLVEIDGQPVTRFDPEGKDVPNDRKWFEPKRERKRPRSGYIALQTHDPGDVVWFKEVSVRPLEAAR
jgi:hypothetical protein